MLMKNIHLYLITYILAFCSIVYELVLAQTISAFLENTVLRYSVTIGLYMFSMGFGAIMAEGKILKSACLTLLRVEILLTVIGGFAVVSLYLVDMLGVSRFIFSLAAHSLIIIIGILTGFEIPLLIEIKGRGSTNKVIGVDYAGAFFGTIIFAFFFYPRLGLISTTFFIGFLNAVAGLMLWSQKDPNNEKTRGPFQSGMIVQTALLITILICLINAQSISQYFIKQYLG